MITASAPVHDWNWTSQRRDLVWALGWNVETPTKMQNGRAPGLRESGQRSHRQGIWRGQRQKPAPPPKDSCTHLLRLPSRLAFHLVQRSKLANEGGATTERKEGQKTEWQGALSSDYLILLLLQGKFIKIVATLCSISSPHLCSQPKTHSLRLDHNTKAIFSDVTSDVLITKSNGYFSALVS